MNEHEDPNGQSDRWTDEDVRRLLADAHLGPGAEAVPDDVAVRLDDVLAGLVAERSEVGVSASGPTEVISVETRRQSRARRWLVAAGGAAAAVVLGGVVLGGGGASFLTGLDDAGTTADMVTDEDDAASDTGGAGPEAADEDWRSSARRSSDLPSRAPVAGTPAFTSDDPERGAWSLVARLSPVAAAASGYAADADEETVQLAAASLELTPDQARLQLGCSVGEATTYAVSYDERAAQAVVEEPAATGDDQVVRVYLCDEAGEPVEVSRVSLPPLP